MTGTTAQPSHEPLHERKGTGTRHTENISGEKTTKPRGRRWGGGNGCQNPARRKLNAPVNRVIYVVSHWACACQRPLISGTLGALSC